MSEPTITCPNCKTEFPLTASLAAPLLEATRREFEERSSKDRERIAAEEAAKAKATLDEELQGRASQIAELQESLRQRNEKVAELQKAQAELAKQRQELEDAKNELDTTVADKVRAEREKIASEAERKARLALQDDMPACATVLADLNQVVESQRTKLQEAQVAQAELLKKQRELEDAKAEMELSIQKGIQEGLDASRAAARKEAEEALGLKLAESQHTIGQMQKQIEDLKRRAEQGSQQLQGEVLELELEARLTAQFPMDTIVPVPKGEYGGDTIQTVCGPLGQPCGTILWESKRTKAWSESWLQKLKDDQRAAKAEVAVIVTQALPKDVSTFDFKDGIWVTNWSCALPVAICLRQSLIELALARQSREGQETKMEAVYEYLTGPHFRQRVQAIVEAFTTMQEDLAKERKAIQAQWAKREKQLERVLGATAGMYGDLYGIAGQSIKAIDGLEFELLLDIDNPTNELE
ncbi:MAG: DUF2130 domain-containing protein [Candidatus Hydrogenedens sp.]|nr:DUF2130 domain-containing protein [Candidatus Hydrogenedens sp.]